MSGIASSVGDPKSRVPQTWWIRGRELAIDRPIVLGVLNATPDSFSDGGQFDTTEAAIAHVDRMVAEGADGVDIGGESTRPQGARAVTAAEEIARVVPIVRAVRNRFAQLPISVDTTKSDVLTAAVAEGADIVNDVSAFRIDPRLSEIAAAERVGVVLMHSRGSVEEMGTYRHASYSADVVDDVLREMGAALDRADAAGVSRQSVVIDPGIGFAKRTEHSLRVLAELERLLSLGCPIMVGVSRKRFIGELSGVMEAQQRVAGTVGANVAALMRGARLFRVHDVAPNRQALDVAWGILRAGGDDFGARQPDEPDSTGSRLPSPGSRRP